MAQKKTQSRSSSKKPPARKSSSESSKLFKMLKDDHEKVMDLFEEVEENASDVNHAQELFAQIQKELQVHMEGEEKFFYPALEQEEDAREQVLEAYEEHNVVKMILKQFGRQSPGDERWMAKVKVLKEIVEHHVQEEEKEMFKMARKALENDQSRTIVERLEQAKEKAGLL